MTGFNPEYDVVPKAEAAAVLPPMKAEKRQQRKKKSGAFGIFRAALYMLRKSTDEKEAAAKKEKSGGGGGDWKKMVGSIRPMHGQEAPASPMHMMSPVHMMSPGSDHWTSPASSSASSCGTMSRYASAPNLRDLCDGEEEIEESERDPDEVFDAITGDEMIDVKAEEFIAQFYKQIQHQNSIHRQNRGV